MTAGMTSEMSIAADSAIVDAIRAVLEWLGAMSWQFAIVFFAVLILDRCLARAGRGELRNALWCLLALKLMLPPQLAAWWRSPDAAGARDLGVAMLGTESGLDVSWRAMVAGLWLAGVGIASITMLVTRRRLRRRFGTAARPAPPEVIDAMHHAAATLAPRRAIPVPRIVLADVSGPLVFGCTAPTIVLPASAVAWCRDDLEHALAHELGHVLRRDLWVQAAWTALVAVYWFHPLVHVAARRAQAARELACDATVAARFGASGYRRSLLRLAALAHGIAPSRVIVPSTAMARLVGRRDGIFSRLRALESGRPNRRRAAIELISFMIVGACGLPLGRPSPAMPDAAVDRARALALETAAARRDDPSTTGSLHVRYALMGLAAAEAASATPTADSGPTDR